MLVTHECAQLLKAQGYKHEQIAKILGVDVRTVSRMLGNPDQQSPNESSFIRALADHGLLPFFAKEWTLMLIDFWRLREQNMRTQIKERYSILFSFVSDGLKRDRAMSSEFRNGALYFCGHYALEMMKDSSENIRERREQAEAYFKEFAGEMEKLNTMASHTFAAKAVANFVVTKWNACPANQRNSKEMRAYIRKFRYFSWLSKQVKHYPKMETPRFNLLATASGLRIRRLYKNLYRGLCELNPKYKDPSVFDTSKPEYNDFVDFVEWLKKQPAELPAMSTIAKALIALAIIVTTMFATLTSVTTNDIMASDLRPHTREIASDLRPHTREIASDLRPHTREIAGDRRPYKLVVADLRAH
jgi:hypothetical protein